MVLIVSRGGAVNQPGPDDTSACSVGPVSERRNVNGLDGEDGGVEEDTEGRTDDGRDIPAHQVLLAGAINRLGHLALSRGINQDLADTVVSGLNDLIERLEVEPEVSVKENMYRRNRVAEFLETGRWPAPPVDGGPIEFDPVSPVGGELNPFSMGARYFRDGDESVGHVTLGPCFEGPPGRVHGGVICSVFDEVLGSVFRAMGTASAFTGELSVRFEQPAPLGVPLEFRGRLVDSNGRRRLMEGEAVGPDGRFATATATFIEMTVEHVEAFEGESGPGH